MEEFHFLRHRFFFSVFPAPLRMEDAADNAASVTFAADTKEEEDVEEGGDEKKGFLETDKGEDKGTDDKEGGGEKRKVTYSEALVRSVK